MGEERMLTGMRMSREGSSCAIHRVASPRRGDRIRVWYDTMAMISVMVRGEDWTMKGVERSACAHFLSVPYSPSSSLTLGQLAMLNSRSLTPSLP